MARSTPIARASSSRSGDTSVMTTKRAPACFATAAAMMPIGPAPVTSTSSPSEGKVNAVWTALPKGSKIAATSRSMSAGCTQTLPAGHDHVLGEGAVAVNADATAVDAEVTSAGTAVAAPAADQVALGADDVADVHIEDADPHLRHLADELVAEDQRRRDRLLRPRVPGLDVQVGATDAGATHADEHVRRSGHGDRHVRQFQSCLGCGLAQGQHQSAARRRKASSAVSVPAVARSRFANDASCMAGVAAATQSDTT